MLAKCQMLCYSIQVGKRKMLSIRKYGRLVKGLRRRPLTAETGVRFPYLLLKLRNRLFLSFFVCALQQKHLHFYFEYAILASVKSP